MFKYIKHSRIAFDPSGRSALSNHGKLNNWLTIPAMVAGALVGTLVFSVVFLAVLIPVGIFGVRMWLRSRKLTNSQPVDGAISAEYTVITESEVADNK